MEVDGGGGVQGDGLPIITPSPLPGAFLDCRKRVKMLNVDPG